MFVILFSFQLWSNLALKEEQIIYKGCLNSKESFETGWRCPKMQNSVKNYNNRNSKFGREHDTFQEYEEDFSYFIVVNQ